MSRTFAPDYGALPTTAGYRPMHTWFVEVKLAVTHFDDGPRYYETWLQARNAAKAYVAEIMAKRIRAEKVEPDVLGLAQWHEQKAAQRAAEQEQALGAVIVRGRTVKIERRQRA